MRDARLRPCRASVGSFRAGKPKADRLPVQANSGQALTFNGIFTLPTHPLADTQENYVPEVKMMRPHRYFWLVACLLLSLPLFAQKEDWLPVAKEDLQLKQVPGDPGAPAIQLYYANYIDDSQDYEFIYHRIKILNESGKQYADVEITGT